MVSADPIHVCPPLVVNQRRSLWLLIREEEDCGGDEDVLVVKFYKKTKANKKNKINQKIK